MELIALYGCILLFGKLSEAAKGAASVGVNLG